MQNDLFSADAEPAEVLRIFSELSAIPHGSENTAAVCDYCENAAHKKGLRTLRDDAGNLVIFKNGTAGFENHTPVILQGHMDMVCEKAPGCTKDFLHEGLNLKRDGDFLSAEGTTLGGDDGIAVAMILELLLGDGFSHPPIEAVFTSDEEVGMLGAAAFDASCLSGKTMINLDSEDDDTFWVGCAGGVRADISLPVKRVIAEGEAFRLAIGGLCGGHSGTEIDKGRENAVLLLSKLLSFLNEQTAIRLVTFGGGLADNAIPTGAQATIFAEDPEQLSALVASFGAKLRLQFADTEPNLYINTDSLGFLAAAALRENDFSALLTFLHEAPNGVVTRSEQLGNLPETSLNLGISFLRETSFTLSYLIRSSVNAEKDKLVSRLSSLTEKYGGSLSLHGDYPAWEYLEDSPLRRKMTEVYEKLFQKTPAARSIHAGLECGIFYQKIPNLDCVSFGPKILAIHTPEEKMSISSLTNVRCFLLSVLTEL